MSDEKPQGKTWPDLIGQVPARLVAYAFILMMCILAIFSGVALYAWYINQTLVLAGYEFGRPSIRSGAIVAYVDECPNDWSPYEPATSRFIVGAGGKFTQGNKVLHEQGKLSVYDVGVKGGDEFVLLTKDEMPKHRHALPLISSNIEYNDAGNGPNTVYFDYRHRKDITQRIIISNDDEGTSESGGGQPHNNMPPYIALYFCKKD